MVVFGDDGGDNVFLVMMVPIFWGGGASVSELFDLSGMEKVE